MVSEKTQCMGCEKRSTTCHNASCPYWAEHEAKKAERYKLSARLRALDEFQTDRKAKKDEYNLRYYGKK